MYIAPELTPKVTWLLEHTTGTLSSTLGVNYLHFDKDKVIAEMPVGPVVRQPFGLLHGGASVVLAESLASVAGWLNVDETKFNVVGMEINANHLRATREGKVIGTATPIHRGQKSQVWEIKITNETGKMVCISRCTLAVVDKLGSSPKP